MPLQSKPSDIRNQRACSIGKQGTRLTRICAVLYGRFHSHKPVVHSLHQALHSTIIISCSHQLGMVLHIPVQPSKGIQCNASGQKTHSRTPGSPSRALRKRPVESHPRRSQVSTPDRPSLCDMPQCIESRLHSLPCPPSSKGPQPKAALAAALHTRFTNLTLGTPFTPHHCAPYRRRRCSPCPRRSAPSAAAAPPPPPPLPPPGAPSRYPHCPWPRSSPR